MGKLMDDDVVNDRLRCHYELPVKAKVAFVGAATPTGLLPSYENSAIGEPQASACLLCFFPYRSPPLVYAMIVVETSCFTFVFISDFIRLFEQIMHA